MAEFKRPANRQEFEENFAPVHPLMNETQAYYESSRCLYCYDAPCVNACPTGIDIPLFIRQIHTGDVTGAAQTIYEDNFFGYACGKVCPTDVLCEGACVYNHQDVKPLEIGRLQSFATGKVLATDKQIFLTGRPNGYRVAIIGAGPAGISCACELRMLGYEVDVFEAKNQPSGLTIHGVAPYKISNEEVLAEVKWLEQQLGFHIHYRHPIESEDQLKQLEETYDAIFLGIGLGLTKSLDLPGENLKNCVGAVEFIEQLRLHQHQVTTGKKVIILGGGNTAMDAASEAARLGAEQVIIAYRRGKIEMSAYPFEYELAKVVGAKGMFYVQPLEIVGNVQVEGVKFVRMISENGKLTPIPGSEFVEPCDTVIYATGQEKQTRFLDKIKDVRWDGKGRIEVDSLTFQTGNPRYFAAGDAVNGGAEVVNAVAEGKKAAKGIHDYLFLGK
ncbi:MAG: NAD(P)-dependent oxidoreductase [Bacteroidia bacterium]|nr:NAD(P)-dependent oxidoreductase [Bacteroidia bacterium]